MVTAAEARRQIRVAAAGALSGKPEPVEVFQKPSEGLKEVVGVVGPSVEKEVKKWEQTELARVKKAEREHQRSQDIARKQWEKEHPSGEATYTYEGLTLGEQSLLDEGYGIEEVQRRRDLAAQKAYELEVIKWESDKVEVRPGEWIDETEWAKIPVEDRPKLKELGTEGYNVWLEGQSVRVGGGEVMSRDDFDSLPRNVQDRIRQIGVTSYNLEVEKEFEAQKAALASLKVVPGVTIESGPPGRVDVGYDLRAALDSGVEPSVLLAAGFSEKDIDEAKAPRPEGSYTIPLASGEEISIPAREWESKSDFEKLTLMLGKAPTAGEMQFFGEETPPSYGGAFDWPFVGGLLSPARGGIEALVPGVQSGVEKWHTAHPDWSTRHIATRTTMPESRYKELRRLKEYYTEMYGPWMASPQLMFMKGMEEAFFPATRLLSPKVSFKDISGREWIETGISTALLGGPTIFKGVRVSLPTIGRMRVPIRVPTGTRFWEVPRRATWRKPLTPKVDLSPLRKILSESSEARWLESKWVEHLGQEPQIVSRTRLLSFGEKGLKPVPETFAPGRGPLSPAALKVSLEAQARAKAAYYTRSGVKPLFESPRQTTATLERVAPARTSFRLGEIEAVTEFRVRPLGEVITRPVGFTIRAPSILPKRISPLVSPSLASAFAVQALPEEDFFALPLKPKAPVALEEGVLVSGQVYPEAPIVAIMAPGKVSPEVIPEFAPIFVPEPLREAIEVGVPSKVSKVLTVEEIIAGEKASLAPTIRIGIAPGEIMKERYLEGLEPAGATGLEAETLTKVKTLMQAGVRTSPEVKPLEKVDIRKPRRIKPVWWPDVSDKLPGETFETVGAIDTRKQGFVRRTIFPDRPDLKAVVTYEPETSGKPSETHSFIGESKGIVIESDMGIVDYYSEEGSPSFRGYGEDTNVGKRMPSKTRGLSIRKKKMSENRIVRV